MNNTRRRKIASIMADVEKLQQQMDSLLERIEEVVEQEQDALDNLPESLQDSERAEAMACAVDNLDEARAEVEGIKESLDNVSGYLEEAKG